MTVCIITCGFISHSVFAIIGISWDDSHHGVAFLEAGLVRLVLCPGEIPDYKEALVTGCREGKEIHRSDLKRYVASLRVLRKVPAKYSDADGLTLVSRDLELLRRQIDETNSKRVVADLRLKEGELEQIQTKLLDLESGMLKFLGYGSSQIYHRQTPQWNEVLSSYYPIWYTQRHWLRLGSGPWGNQANICFSPWRPWDIGNSQVLAEVIFYKVLAGRSTVLWTPGEHQTRLMGPWHGGGRRGGSAVVYDDMGRSHPSGNPSTDSWAQIRDSLPVYGIAVDAAKFQLDSNSPDAHPYTTYKTNRLTFVGMAFSSNGLGPSKDPYDYDTVAKGTNQNILCVMDGP